MSANESLAIQTTQLARTYRTYEKQQGLWGSIQGFWNREYKEKVALAPTNLKIEQGQIVGLVGANGAGKTTLLKMLSGLIYPSAGEAKVLGYTPWERNHDYLRQMSILLGQKNQLWWDISPYDSYSLLADIYDLDKKAALGRVDELADLLKCTGMLKTQLRRLSLGERMKMEIIGSLLHEPKILFLDEPTIGLDIVAQTSIRKFLAEYVVRKNPTVILTSHYMDDIAKLADRLLLISQGAIVYDGTVNGFVQNSKAKKKILFTTTEPLSKTITLGEQTFATGTLEFAVETNEENLSSLLNQITSLPTVGDLRIEQVDFEEVIHDFLREGQR
jgi:ABC-2 type transport system ATP-binding protein